MSQVDEFHQAVGKCKQCSACLIVPQELKDEKGAENLVISKGQSHLKRQVSLHGTEHFFKTKQ